jgi:hypothetical protein
MYIEMHTQQYIKFNILILSSIELAIQQLSNTLYICVMFLDMALQMQNTEHSTIY